MKFILTTKHYTIRTKADSSQSHAKCTMTCFPQENKQYDISATTLSSSVFIDYWVTIFSI